MVFLASNITPYGHLEESGHQIAHTNLIFPGVRGQLKKTITVDDGITLSAGTTVIIQPLNRDKSDSSSVFVITPYKKNKTKARKDQPESHRDIITEKSYTVTLTQPENFLNFNNEHFRRSLDVLFPHANSPSLEEINQCRLPDCFFLAAIQAIINHPNGKSFIRGMMRQNNDGTTTVRLFDPLTLQPEYIRIENSVMVDGLGEINRHGALWVHMLEKAYAARGKKDTVTVDASISSVYSDGGRPDYALVSLTGLKTDYIEIQPKVLPLQIEEFLGK